MVSFSCEACGDVLTKKKLDPHRNRCRGATFTCIDCMVHFPGTEYRTHTSCMTEEQKYQGALYKNKKAKTTATSAPSSSDNMARTAYVEDAPEFEKYRVYDEDESKSTNGVPPHAPSPPPASDGVNVFDFLVASATPNASNLNLPQDQPAPAGESTELVRYDRNTNEYLDPSGYMVEDGEALVQYGTGPVPAGPSYETPAPKAERKKTKDSDREVKKDKKRKRLHLDIADQVMTDAPPVLHSGLTGGLNRLMSRPHVFPPSPDYSGSGGDGADTPASPLKKSKHGKHSKTNRAETIGNNLISMLTNGGSKSKTKKRKHSTSSTTKKHHHHHHHRDGKEPKLIEYRPDSKDGKEGESGTMVVYKPRADLFLSFVTKGPESERGCSMNKALKRFHRERDSAGNSLGKLMEEKELWRSLRMRRNDRGEIVLFCPS
ncbi:LYAR-type C2HC zinc finger [Pleurostoma richardsiae]|uniref:LYAR-type C2HC zinc finger n=1 Tax=Pleurostoma richardsiae TaxID=41990 RepID=A0AA38W0Z2_9PEZI|nr:LYAR-type C2HC zinc finger [Pleurostoma richardsiae]